MKNIGENHLGGEVQFGSPVSDFTDVDVLDRRPVENSEKKSDEESSEPELGVVDYAEEAEDKSLNLQRNIQSIADSTNDLEYEIVNRTEELGEMQKEGQLSPKRANELIKSVASEIRSYTNLVDENVESIDSDLGFLMNAIQSLVEFSDPTIQAHREILRDQRHTLVDFRSESMAAVDGVKEFRDEARQLEGLNRELDQATGDLSSVLSTLIDVLTESNAKAERMISLIDQELKEDK